MIIILNRRWYFCRTMITSCVFPEPNGSVRSTGDERRLDWWMLEPTGTTHMVGRPSTHFLCCKCIPDNNLHHTHSYINHQNKGFVCQWREGTSLLGSSIESTNSSVSLKTAYNWKVNTQVHRNYLSVNSKLELIKKKNQTMAFVNYKYSLAFVIIHRLCLKTSSKHTNTNCACIIISSAEYRRSWYFVNKFYRKTGLQLIPLLK